MLVGNRSVLHKSPGHFLSGTVASNLRNAFSKPGQMANRFQSLNRLDAAIPNGHLSPSAWSLPRTAGGMSARNVNDITVSLGALVLAAGRNIDGSTTLTWSVPSAALQLVVSATGTSSITFSNAGTLAGALSAVGTAAITFSVPTVTLGAVISAMATTALTWSTTGTARATGALEADSNPTVDLSPATLAAAVWAEVLESGLDAADVMRLLLAVAAGKTDISGTTVTFRDQADTKNRVTAEMTGSERTTVVVNAG